MSYLSLLKRYPNYIAFGASYNFFSNMGQTFIFALFIPDLERAFNLTSAQSGGYYGIAGILSAFLLLYTGSLIDRIHLRTYSVTIALLTSLSAFLMAYSPNLAIMLIAMFLLRHLCQGLMIHTATTTITRFFTKTRGKAVGLSSLGFPLGQIILPVIIAIIISTYSWQMGYAFIGVVCLLFCVPINYVLFKKNDPFQMPQPHEHTPLLDKEELNWERKQLLGHSYFWFIIPSVLTPWIITTPLIFHQGALAASRDWSMTLIASGFAACGLAQVVSVLLIGPLIDRFSAKSLLPFANVPIAIGIAFLLVSDSPWTLYVYMWLIGIGIGFSMISVSLWAEVYGTKHLGAIKSLIHTLAILATAASPPLLGWLLTKEVSFDTVIIWGIAFIILTATLAFIAKPPKVKPDRLGVSL